LSTFKNTLLKNLDADIVERLSLRPVTFELKHGIEFPGKTNRASLFFRRGHGIHDRNI
jgi:hypothetical protein